MAPPSEAGSESSERRVATMFKPNSSVPDKISGALLKHNCNLCNRSFARGEHLQRHKQSHRKERPFPCQYCSNKFARRDTLVRHTRKFHPNQISPWQRPNSVSPSTPSESLNADGLESAQNSPDADAPRDITELQTRDIEIGNAASYAETQVPPVQVIGPPDTVSQYLNTDSMMLLNDLGSANTTTQSRDHFNSLELLAEAGTSLQQSELISTAEAPPAADLSMHGVPGVWFPDFDPDFFNVNDLPYGSSTPDDIYSNSAANGNFRVQSMYQSPSIPFTFENINLLNHSESVSNQTPPGGNNASSVWPSVSDSDMDSFKQNLESFTTSMGNKIEFILPSMHKANRYLQAYFRYFDPHAPIIHLATFSFATAPPALCLAILSIGALYGSEPETAVSLYKISSNILDIHEKFQISLGRKMNEATEIVWELQTHVLLAQFTMCHGEDSLYQHDLSHIHRAEQLFRRGLPDLALESRWLDWVCGESFRRAGLWVLILCAPFVADGEGLMHLPTLEDITEDLPCSEEIWTAQTDLDWQMSGSDNSEFGTSQAKFITELKLLLQGYPLVLKISSFGMLVLSAGLLLHVLTIERTSFFYDSEESNGKFPLMEKAEKSLELWNSKWKSHPNATSHPFDYRHGPLLADCIPILTMAYYHTRVSRRLKRMKASLTARMVGKSPFNPGDELRVNPEYGRRGVISFLELEDILTASTEAEWENLSYVAKIATSSLLLRAKMGFKYVARTAPLDMGFHYVFAGFEGSLILSSWIYTANKQGRTDPETLALQSLIDSIIEEMDDQRRVKEYPAIAPLVSIRSMAECGWIWTFPHKKARYLSIQESRIISMMNEAS